MEIFKIWIAVRLKHLSTYQHHSNAVNLDSECPIQVTTLEAMKEGEVPDAPEPVTVIVKEPEVRIVEVRQEVLSIDETQKYPFEDILGLCRI